MNYSIETVLITATALFSFTLSNHMNCILRSDAKLLANDNFLIDFYLHFSCYSFALVLTSDRCGLHWWTVKSLASLEHSGSVRESVKGSVPLWLLHASGWHFTRSSSAEHYNFCILQYCKYLVKSNSKRYLRKWAECENIFMIHF